MGWGPTEGGIATKAPEARSKFKRSCVRDARPKGRDPGGAECGGVGQKRRCRGGMESAGGSTQLATVVSLPTARAARPGAKRRDTPKLIVPISCS